LSGFLEGAQVIISRKIPILLMFYLMKPVMQSETTGEPKKFPIVHKILQKGLK
jgi:hypothetical protein